MSAANVSPSGQAVRVIGWSVFVVLAAVCLGLAAFEMPVAYEATLVNVLVYLLPMVLATIGAGVLVARTTGAERRFWGMLMVASGILVVTESYWTWYTTTIDPHGPQLPAPYELLQMLAAVLFVGVFIAMTSFGRLRLVTRIRYYLDVVAAVIVAASLVYVAWTLPVFELLPGGGWQVAAIAAAYPVTGALLILLSIAVFIGWKAERWQSWERLISISLVLYGLGLCAFPLWYQQLLLATTPAEPTWFAIALGFGYYLLFMATVYRSTSISVLSGEPWSIPRPSLGWLGVAYPVAISLALPFLGWSALLRAGEPSGLPVDAAAFALAGVLIVRSWLSALERAYHRELAITDPVSGAYNHRYLHESLADDLLRAATTRRPLAVIVFDIDDFKGINNLHGHEAGDALLRELAELVQSAFGMSSRVFRFGSDEFVAVVRDVDADQATEIARSMRQPVREILLGGTPVTLSTGIAMFPTHGEDGEQLLARAMAAQQLARVADADDVIVYDERVVGAVDPFERLARAQQRARRATVRTLAAAVDARDSDTRNHSENVAELASALAQVLGMSQQQIRVVELAARLHDIGKIGIRDEVLLKEEPLSDEDLRHVREHPTLGVRILQPAQLDEILPAVRHHHENWDGSGYPDGLRGPQIPLEARVLSVCDSFEAMTATRSYRESLSVGEALKEIERRAGSQFDPDVAFALARMVTHLHGYAASDRAERLGRDGAAADTHPA